MHLRTATPADTEAIHALFGKPAVYRYLADGIRPPRKVTEEWLAQVPEDTRAGGGLWVLIDAENRHGGLVRLTPEEETQSGEFELTYLLHPDLWGRGIATRRAHAALAVAFGSGGVSMVLAGADAPNTASIAVIERLGMRFRQHVTYPLGPGVEYELRLEEFEPDRFERLPVD